MNGILLLTTAILAAICIDGTFGAGAAANKADCLAGCVKEQDSCHLANSCNIQTRLFADKRKFKLAEQVMRRFAATGGDANDRSGACSQCDTDKMKCDDDCNVNYTAKGKAGKREFLEGLSSYLDLVGF